MPLNATAHADIVESVLSQLPDKKYTELATDTQIHHAMPKLMKKDKVQFQRGGYQITNNVMLDHTHSARSVGLYEVDAVDRRQLMGKITVDWRHCTVNFPVERRELLMNRDGWAIYDLIRTQRDGMYIALAEEMEGWMWTKLSADNDRDPYSVLYWINKYASGETTPSFSGAQPFGSGTYCGGLNNDRFKNWAGQYTNVTVADLIDKCADVFRVCRFKSPVDIPNYADDADADYVIYTTRAVIKALERLARMQNENLGNDLLSYQGRTVIFGAPVRWVPTLDDDSHDPLYWVNWRALYPVLLDGDYFHETQKWASSQHNVREVHLDITYNLCAHSVRGLAVLSTGTDKS